MKNIDFNRSDLREFCVRHGIFRLSLFGSVLRDDFSRASDIDILVEFEQGTQVGLFELYDLEQELSVLFGGRRVDISTLRSLSPYFRDEVMAEAQTEYVKT